MIHFSNEQIKKNGQIIYESVGPNSLITTVIDFGAYFGDPSNPPGMHAVCLIGTAITPRKNMDVYIFDPRRGRVWIPIEHLTDAFADERLLVLERVS